MMDSPVASRPCWSLSGGGGGAQVEVGGEVGPGLLLADPVDVEAQGGHERKRKKHQIDFRKEGKMRQEEERTAIN